MGGEATETWWATHKHQIINLWNCCILLVDLSESYDDARTWERKKKDQFNLCPQIERIMISYHCLFVHIFFLPWHLPTKNWCKIYDNDGIKKVMVQLLKPTTETEPESAQSNAIHISTMFPVFPLLRRLSLLMLNKNSSMNYQVFNADQ
jgi:hypothetical protein